MANNDLRELEIRPVKLMPSLYEIRFANGGEVPKMLAGKWSSRSDAQRGINRFHAGVDAKVIRRKTLKRAPVKTIEV